jgi:ABC-type Mn2+/Zn2+ transport system permease subunit
MMMSETSGLALSIGMAAAAGLVGCFAVMRRMSLASDALSHVALPGIGLAIVLRIHPAVGATAMLALGALLIWGLERKTRISTETIIGVVFSAALAIGSMLATGEELMDALLGTPAEMRLWEGALGLVGSAAIITFLLTQRERLVVSLVSADIARTSGIAVDRLELTFLLSFALTVALGLRYLGVLLMGSLVIIPAATAKYLAKSLTGMFTISVSVAVLSTILGEWMASRLHRPTGPIIISIAAGFFFVSLLARRQR